MRSTALVTTLVLAAVPTSAQLGPNDLLVASAYTDEVLRYDVTTGQFVGAFVPASVGGLARPLDLEFGPDGDLYVVSFSSAEVLRYDGDTGAFLGAAVTFPAAGIDRPETLAFGPDGRLFVGGYQDTANPTNAAVIARFDLASGGPGTQLVLSHLFHAAIGGLEFGPGGVLHVMTLGRGVVGVDAETGAYLGTLIPGEGPGWLESATFLTDVAFAPDGLLYVRKAFGRIVDRYVAATGVYVDRFAGPQNVNGGGLEEGGLTFGPDGDWYVSVTSGPNADRIVRRDRVTGEVVEFLDPTNLAGLAGPASITFPPRIGTTYGCGGNPAGSLVELAGLPRLGATFTLGVDDPTGTTTPGSPAIAWFSPTAAPGFPCGTSVAGFGLGGGAGELLIDPAASPFAPLLSSAPWTVSGTPAPIDVALPNTTALVGRDFFVQGALFDVGGGPGFRLAGALSVRILR